jgi:O-antigen ligase
MASRQAQLSPILFGFLGLAFIGSVMAKGELLLDPFHAPRWTALAFLSALVWLRMATLFRDNRERSPFSALTMRSLLGLLAVYGLCNVLSLSRMESQAEGLWSLVQNGIGSLFLFGLAALALRDVTAMTKHSLMTYFGLGLVMTGIVHAHLALADAYCWMESPFESGWGPAGWSGNRNLVAGFQVLVLPWSFLLWIPFTGLARKGTLLLSAFAVALGGAVLGVCQSRASLLAILLGLVWSVGLWLWHSLRLRDANPRTRLSPTRWIPLGLWVLFALGFLSQANRVQPETRVTALEKWALSHDPPHASHISVVERLALWKKTLGLIADHPVLGVGVGHWKIAWASQGLSGLPQQDMSVMHTRPHNDWLWVFSEIGLLGGTAYILLPLLALILFHKATDLHPYFIHAWNDRAAAQLNLGDTLAAMASLQSIRMVAPGYAKSMFPLAWLLHTRGHMDAALGILDSMPEVDSATEEGRNRVRLRKALTGSQ